MAYMNPKLVNGPKAYVSNLNVIYDGGENGWSLAEMDWDGHPVKAMRWNGGSNDPRFQAIGNPQSRGVPTWFVLPDEVGQAITQMLNLAKAIKQ